jgi:hypothetical protein
MAMLLCDLLFASYPWEIRSESEKNAIGTHVVGVSDPGACHNDRIWRIGS